MPIPSLVKTPRVHFLLFSGTKAPVSSNQLAKASLMSSLATMSLLSTHLSARNANFANLARPTYVAKFVPHKEKA